MKRIISLLALICLCSVSLAQKKQLVLLKRQDVLLRLYPGDEIRLKVKGRETPIKSYVNNLFDNAIMLHRDTIPFSEIERIYFHQSVRANVYGTVMVVGGVLLFGIDQLNQSVVQDKEASLDPGVVAVSAVLVGAGLPMMLWKKKSQKLTYKYRLLTVKEGSAFYKPKPNESSSPYLGN